MKLATGEERVCPSLVWEGSTSSRQKQGRAAFPQGWDPVKAHEDFHYLAGKAYKGWRRGFAFQQNLEFAEVGGKYV